MKIQIGKRKITVQMDKVDVKTYKIKGNFLTVTTHGYVALMNYVGNKKGYPSYKREYLHRLITKAPKGLFVDHINGDKLDNRKKNLRICTSAQSACNTKTSSNSKSGFKGVWKLPYGRWCAQITKNREKIHVGVFDTPEEAALAYNKKAKELHGEFAWLNKVKK